MELRPPRHERTPVRLLPELHDQGAQERHLRQAHAGVRRHLEAAKLDEALAPGGRVQRMELVDTELGAMGVACQIGQETTQRTIDQRRRDRLLDLFEASFELPQAAGAALVDPRCLRSCSDERSREQIRERRVVLPVGDERAQKIGPA